MSFDSSPRFPPATTSWGWELIARVSGTQSATCPCDEQPAAGAIGGGDERASRPAMRAAGEVAVAGENHELHCADVTARMTTCGAIA